MTTPPRKSQALCVIIMLLCLAAFSCNKSKVTGIVGLPPPPPIQHACEITSIMSWDTLQMIIREKGKIVMDIYPVKYSDNPANCSPDLVTYLRKADGTPIPRPGDLPEDKFNEVAKNFISFLHFNDVAREDIEMGYQIAMDENTETQLKQIKLTYSAFRHRLTFPDGLKKFDSCRVPPDCFMSMLRRSSMEAMIDSVYSDDDK